MKLVNFPKQKIGLMAWESEEDFIRFLKRCDELFNRAQSYPVFYMIHDEEAKKEDIGKLEAFLKEMIRMKVDLDTIKRNVEANRFKEFS